MVKYSKTYTARRWTLIYNLANLENESQEKLHELRLEVINRLQIKEREQSLLRNGARHALLEKDNHLFRNYSKAIRANRIDTYGIRYLHEALKLLNIYIQWRKR